MVVILNPIKNPEEEIKQLNDYARATFAQYAAWWAFFIAQNLVAAAFLSDKNNRPDNYVELAVVVAVLDAVGAMYCMIVSMRLTQIDERIQEIATQTPPDESPIGNPMRPRKLFRHVFKRLRKQPTRTLDSYNSPVPLNFYLWCTVPTSVMCIFVTCVWSWCILQQPQNAPKVPGKKAVAAKAQNSEFVFPKESKTNLSIRVS